MGRGHRRRPAIRPRAADDVVNLSVTPAAIWAVVSAVVGAVHAANDVVAGLTVECVVAKSQRCGLCHGRPDRCCREASPASVVIASATRMFFTLATAGRAASHDDVTLGNADFPHLVD